MRMLDPSYVLAGAVVLSAGAAMAAPPAAFGPLPTPGQLRMAEREMYAFCHFTVDTFTDKEWGGGDEQPAVFNPTAFDANQIVGALKAGGFKGVILTCKHHDGFCLWPTQTTKHNVSASPFRDGKGDVVREFADACKRAGVEFGVYLSPWDRNNEHYGRPEYVTQVYRKQWEELLTQYGPIFEVWMDGANGGTGYYGGAGGSRSIDRSTYYDWENTWALIRKWQPGAVCFSDVGPDCRWCGNESGYAGDPCWATYTPHSPEPGKAAMPGFVKHKEGENGHRDGKFWLPAEVDVSIRPGWFWHAAQNDKVRSPQNLMQLYLNSVGRGATFLLNAPPDRRGLLHENDVASIAQFGEHLRRTFAVNLAQDAKVTASHVREQSERRYGPAKLLDDDRWSAWVTDDTTTTPEVVFTLSKAQTFNLIRLREDIRLGQRVEAAAVDAWVDGAWKEIAKAESIGFSRLWRVPAVTTDRVRVRVVKSPVCPALSDFGLFLEPDIAPWAPTAEGRVRAAAKAGWKIVSASYENVDGGAAANAIDGNPGTLWHTHGPDGEKALPQELVVDMGRACTLAGFTYLPRQDRTAHGMVDQFAFFVSGDGQTWQPAAEGEFANVRNNPVEQTIPFAPAKARYFKFVAKHAVEKNHATVAELGVVLQP